MAGYLDIQCDPSKEVKGRREMVMILLMEGSEIRRENQLILVYLTIKFYTSQVVQDFFHQQYVSFLGVEGCGFARLNFFCDGKGFDKNPSRGNTLLETSSFGSTNKMDFASFGHDCPGLAMLEILQLYTLNIPTVDFHATRLQIWNLFLVPSTRSQQYSQHIALR